MSNFLKRGQRALVKKQKKIVKGHVQQHDRILREIDTVASDLISVGDPLTAEQIQEELESYFERPADSLEVLLLKSKLNQAGLYDED